MVIGHEKGNDTASRIERNFGMARPEGYRKAIRLMDIADRFRLPVITLVDTPGAYPGKARRGTRSGRGDQRARPIAVDRRSAGLGHHRRGRFAVLAAFAIASRLAMSNIRSTGDLA